jgi:hypothetical protein
MQDHSSLPHGLKGAVVDPPVLLLGILAALLVALILVGVWLRYKRRVHAKQVETVQEMDHWAAFEAQLTRDRVLAATHCAKALRTDLVRSGVSAALTLDEIERLSPAQVSAELMQTLRLCEEIVFAGKSVDTETLADAAKLARQSLSRMLNGAGPAAKDGEGAS